MDNRTESFSEQSADAPFAFELPPELIAQEPAARRRDSRLLVLRRGACAAQLHAFGDLVTLLRPGDLLVVNDSRVLPARLWTRRADTGGRVELLLLEPASAPAGAWLALARPVRRLRPGVVLQVVVAGKRQSQAAAVELVACLDGGEVVIRPGDGGDLAALAVRCGEVPLPPYIRREPFAPAAGRRRDLDRQRYQTVYARTDPDGLGSVAAPTAGLHFDADLIAQLAARGIETARLTLHVGLGTFRRPTAAQIAAGRLHAERFSLPPETWRAVAACRARGARVVAVGTTSLRVLETVAGLALDAAAPVGARLALAAPPAAIPPVCEAMAVRTAAGWAVDGVTRLFIQPPQTVTAADGLLTNFHLPGSSLLRLVAAFTGAESWRAAYRQAVAWRLRFFSYGDAMLILPPSEIPV